jgi:hypothetical protein
MATGNYVHAYLDFSDAGYGYIDNSGIICNYVQREAVPFQSIAVLLNSSREGSMKTPAL